MSLGVILMGLVHQRDLGICGEIAQGCRNNLETLFLPCFLCQLVPQKCGGAAQHSY
jgi:hypothetical protein